MKARIQLYRAHLGNYRGLFIGIAFNHLKGWPVEDGLPFGGTEDGEPDSTEFIIGLLFICLQIKITGKIPTE